MTTFLDTTILDLNLFAFNKTDLPSGGVNGGGATQQNAVPVGVFTGGTLLSRDES
jgi:hypothetical protein